MANNKKHQIFNRDFNLDIPKQEQNRLLYFRSVFSIIVLFFLFILAVNLFRKINSGSSVSFSAFLEFLGSLDSFTVNFSISDFTIGGNWGIIDGLRNFINVFAYFLGVTLWMFLNLYNCLVYIFRFIQFLFVQGFFLKGGF